MARVITKEPASPKAKPAKVPNFHEAFKLRPPTPFCFCP